MPSNIERCLELLRSEGWHPEKAEKWIQFRGTDKTGKARTGGVRVDLFGVVDIAAIKSGQPLLGVQACSGSGHAAHRKKALAEPRLRIYLAGIGNVFEIWSWSQKGPRGEKKKWAVRREAITLDQWEEAQFAGGNDGPF